MTDQETQRNDRNSNTTKLAGGREILAIHLAITYIV
jgi:hypothetical protein